MTLEDVLNKYIKNKSCELDNFRLSELIDDLNTVYRKGIDKNFFNSVNIEDFNLTKLEKSFLMACFSYLSKKYNTNLFIYDYSKYRLTNPYITFNWVNNITFRAFLFLKTPPEFSILNIFTGEEPLSSV